jgi:hypothetical protein
MLVKRFEKNGTSWVVFGRSGEGQIWLLGIAI